jgi:hypothetical protein
MLALISFSAAAWKCAARDQWIGWSLRDGAFRPWYKWPLLQSFGGLGTLVIVLQYFEGVWENGIF